MGVEPETDRELRETGNDNETYRKLNRLETRKPEYKTKPEKHKNHKNHDTDKLLTCKSLWIGVSLNKSV